MTKTQQTQTGGTLKGYGRILRIDPHGTMWIVTETTSVEAQFTTGTESVEAVEVLGYFPTKTQAIAAARKLIVP